MPIHTSTTVVPIQQNDRVIEPRPELNTYSAKVLLEQDSKITVTLRERRFCSPLRLEQQRIITRSVRPQTAVRNVVELSAILLGTSAMIWGGGEFGKAEPSPIKLVAAYHGAGIALAGLTVLIIDGVRAFDETTTQDRLVSTTMPARECDHVLASGQSVKLRFQETPWLEGVTGDDGQIVFPLDAAAQAALREHKGRFSVWHQGKLLGDFGASPP